jgi:hypothetical protein
MIEPCRLASNAHPAQGTGTGMASRCATTVWWLPAASWDTRRLSTSETCSRAYPGPITSLSAAKNDPVTTAVCAAAISSCRSRPFAPSDRARAFSTTELI